MFNCAAKLGQADEAALPLLMLLLHSAGPEVASNLMVPSVGALPQVRVFLCRVVIYVINNLYMKFEGNLST